MQLAALQLASSARFPPDHRRGGQKEPAQASPTTPGPDPQASRGRRGASGAKAAAPAAGPSVSGAVQNSNALATPNSSAPEYPTIIRVRALAAPLNASAQSL